MSNTITPQTETGKNYILSIAIDDYSNTEFDSLEHSERNLEALFSILTDKYEFDKTDITRLYNSFATKKEIEQTFKTFKLKDSTEDDSLLIFFSGHGDIKNEKHGCLVLRDGTELLNTELLQLIELLKPFKNIVVFLNCCHSGTIFSDKSNVGRTNLGMGATKCRKAIASNQGKDKTFDDSLFIPTITSVLKEHEHEDPVSATYIFDQMRFAMETAEPPAYVRFNDITSHSEGAEFHFKLKETEEKVWIKTLDLNSIEGYSLYLKKFTKNKEEAQIKLDQLIEQENYWKVFLKLIADKFQSIRGNHFATKHLDTITQTVTYFSRIHSELETEEKSNNAWKGLNKYDINEIKDFLDNYSDSRFYKEAEVIYKKLKKAYDDKKDWEIIEASVKARISRFDKNQGDYASYLATHNEIANPFYLIAKNKHADVFKYLTALNEKDNTHKIQKLKEYIKYLIKSNEYKDYKDEAEKEVGKLEKEVNDKKDEEDINIYFEQKSISKLKDFIETSLSEEFTTKAGDYITIIKDEFEAVYKKASKSDSINQIVDGVTTLNNYPDAHEYRDSLIQLRKEKDEDMYRLTTTIEGCEDYLLEFKEHEGRYSPYVKEKLDQFIKEKQDFDIIKKWRTIDLHKMIDLCEVFLLKYTEGGYKNEITKLKSEVEIEIKDDTKFSEISNGFTIENCKEYLKVGYTKHKDTVTKELQKLIKEKADEDAYENIVSQIEKRTLNTQELIQLCKNYRIEFENYIVEIATILDNLLIDEKEEYDFEKMISVGTNDSVNDFLMQYPQGRKKQEAEYLLNELEQNERVKAEKIKKENDDFAETIRLGTKKAFEDYLEKYPNGLKKQEAESNIQKFLIEEKDIEVFEKAKIINTIDAYKDYLFMFEKPLSAVEANKRIAKLERIIKNKQVFDKAIVTNTPEAYANYISEFSKDGDAESIRIIMAKMNKLMLGDTLNDTLPTKKNTEVSNEWLKPASILQIVIIILLIVSIFFVKK